MRAHTTDDVITHVTRYLYATNRLPLPGCPPPERVTDLVRDVIEALESERLTLPDWITRDRHHRILDDQVQDAIRNLPDDDYDRGYDAALDDIALLADDTPDTPNTQTPAA